MVREQYATIAAGSMSCDWVAILLLGHLERQMRTQEWAQEDKGAVAC